MTLIKKDININFQVKRGNSFSQSFELVDCVSGLETPINLTGSTVDFLVTRGGITFITGTATLSGSPVSNTIDVFIDSSLTNIYPSLYDYTLIVTSSGSPVTIDTYICGTFEIL